MPRRCRSPTGSAALEPGNDADIVVLDSGATPAMRLRMETVETLAEELFLLQTLGDDRAVVETYVAGRPAKSALAGIGPAGDRTAIGGDSNGRQRRYREDRRAGGGAGLPAFDEATAFAIGSAIRERGLKENLPIVVDIRTFDRPLFYAALPGSTADNANWARRKRNVVQKFLKSTYRMVLEQQRPDRTFKPGSGSTRPTMCWPAAAFR